MAFVAERPAAAGASRASDSPRAARRRYQDRRVESAADADVDEKGRHAHRNQPEQVASDESDLHRRCPRPGRDRLGALDPAEGRALGAELIRKRQRNVQDRGVQPDDQQDEGESSNRRPARIAPAGSNHDTRFAGLVVAVEQVTEHGLSLSHTRRRFIGAPPRPAPRFLRPEPLTHVLTRAQRPWSKSRWACRGSGGSWIGVPGGASSSTRPGVSRGRNTAELWQQRQPAATTEYSERHPGHRAAPCIRQRRDGRSGRGPSPGSSRCVATARSSLHPRLERGRSGALPRWRLITADVVATWGNPRQSRPSESAGRVGLMQIISRSAGERLAVRGERDAVRAQLPSGPATRRPSGAGSASCAPALRRRTGRATLIAGLRSEATCAASPSLSARPFAASRSNGPPISVSLRDSTTTLRIG